MASLGSKSAKSNEPDGAPAYELDGGPAMSMSYVDMSALTEVSPSDREEPDGLSRRKANRAFCLHKQMMTTRTKRTNMASMITMARRR